MAPTRTVLALHGYCQSGAIFSKRIGALRKQCKDVEFVFVDAPLILEPVDIVGSAPQNTATKVDSTVPSVGASEAGTDPALVPRGWWKKDLSSDKYIGIEESIAVIREVLRKRRFDVSLHHSQGAAFAGLLAALLERPETYPPFLVDGKAPHPPFEFCINVAGFKARDPLFEDTFGAGYSTPTLHVIGRNDVVVVPERSQTLVDASLNGRLEMHDGGHFVPSKGPWRKFLESYIRLGPSAELASPSGGGESAPGSGTATPAL
ncbi:serine hydrolase FSH [Schizophyllum amplum]|uniref:Serine hydrolase FSH n=1 Tax=Schizophyllum amplum TaxID=97359 RepID=A0A550CVZ0_9AGAR|nr:serine hydrolase FSH [Auriculariopsis ampla]